MNLVTRQIYGLKKKKNVPLPPSPFAHYKFNETNGLIANDEYGLRNMQGSDTNMWNGLSRNGDASIYSLASSSFFKLNTIDGNLILNKGAFSYCVWCYSVDGSISPMSKGGNAGGSNRVFRVDRANAPRLLVANQTGAWATTAYAPADTTNIANNWFHFALVLSTNPGLAKMYVNGILKYSVSYTSSGFVQDDVWDFATGSQSISGGIGGYLNNLVLYDRVLSELEINEIMNKT
jgi:hypothetical protein